MGAANRSTNLRLCAALAISTLARAASPCTTPTMETGSASHALCMGQNQVQCSSHTDLLSTSMLHDHVNCGLQRQYQPFMTSSRHRLR